MGWSNRCIEVKSNSVQCSLFTFITNGYNLFFVLNEKSLVRYSVVWTWFLGKDQILNKWIHNDVAGRIDGIYYEQIVVVRPCIPTTNLHHLDKIYGTLHTHSNAWCLQAHDCCCCWETSFHSFEIKIKKGITKCIRFRFLPIQIVLRQWMCVGFLWTFIFQMATQDGIRRSKVTMETKLITLWKWYATRNMKICSIRYFDTNFFGDGRR